MPAARVRAFAKINLTLEVLARRPDGFHDLRTVFQTISLADSIDVVAERARQTHVWVESDVEIPGENLIVRAAHAVLEMLGMRADVRFRLKKRIPMGGGLGGGSTDAAAVLRVLPGLLGKTPRREPLLEAAARLGSDVPVFLMGGTVLGLGRGTELYPLPDLPPIPALVVAPDIHVSTPEAYKSLGRTAEFLAPSNRTAQFTAALADGEPWEPHCTNDFEDAVFVAHPEIGRIRKRLQRSGATVARMSGSGSSVFALFPDKGSRDAAASKAGEQAFRVTLLPRSRYR